jgi:hypothetical protein
MNPRRLQVEEDLDALQNIKSNNRSNFTDKRRKELEKKKDTFSLEKKVTAALKAKGSRRFGDEDEEEDSDFYDRYLEEIDNLENESQNNVEELGNILEEKLKEIKPSTN